MPLEKLAEEYLETINSLKNKISSLDLEVSITSNLELKRKIREKKFSYESILRQCIATYHHLVNYYNKEVNVRAWI